MTEIEKQIKRIMAAPVAGLVQLSDRDFEVVLSLILAERLKGWPKVKRPAKAGK